MERRRRVYQRGSSLPGELHGRFELIAPIGSGGLATVWRALDRKTRLPVALKVLHPHMRGDRVVAERFRREAAVLRTVSHASVVRAFEVFEDEGALSFSMELLEGRTLKERIRVEGPLPPEEVVRIARETLAGLAAAHAAGVTHRDLKPQNVFLLPDGTVKLLDFGFARIHAAAGLTTRSLVLCTPDYAAPEHIEGKPVDGRADLYALGVVLYEALTGKLPFRGATPFDLLKQHLTQAPPSLKSARPEVPPELEAVVSRLLQKRPEDRFSTAQAVAEALERPALASPAVPEMVCPACGSPREMDWPICPACGATDGSAVTGEWMVVLVRVPDTRHAAPLLREIVRSVGAEAGHDLALGSPEVAAGMPKILVKGISESLARLLRERCLAKDVQVELRQAGEDNIDLLYRSTMPAFVFGGGAAVVWLALLTGVVALWLSTWSRGASLSPLFYAASVLVGAALAAGPGIWGFLRRSVEKILPPLARIPTAGAGTPLPAGLVERYRQGLARVREPAMKGTLRRLFERALVVHGSARNAPEHLLQMLEEPRAAALALVRSGIELAEARQEQLDRLAAMDEGALFEELEALKARAAAEPSATLEPLIESREAALATVAELERAQALTGERLLQVATALELAAVRLLAAGAPDVAGVSMELRRVEHGSEVAERTAQAMAKLGTVG